MRMNGSLSLENFIDRPEYCRPEKVFETMPEMVRGSNVRAFRPDTVIAGPALPVCSRGTTPPLIQGDRIAQGQNFGTGVFVISEAGVRNVIE